MTRNHFLSSIRLLLTVCLWGGFSCTQATHNVDSHETVNSLRFSPLTLLQKPLHLVRQDAVSAHDPSHFSSGAWTASSANYSTLIDALQVMQSHFFEITHGAWPDAIDWTSEMMSTHVSATLAAISKYSPAAGSDPGTRESQDAENTINRYFTQLASFYFGENDFSLRMQAYDDMLWVVLNWLEAIKFIDLHATLHHDMPTHGDNYHDDSRWYAHQFVPQFAHRARLFYDIAFQGWDTTLCGGGMVWNPRLTPYKNAITNELFITASISMYLFFPGDENSSPFVSEKVERQGLPPARANDEKYLHNAIEGYRWLKESGMRNTQGLYVDGFHITGWRSPHSGDPSNGTSKCDARNEMVYTYNQGVLLSGLSYLWEATGDLSYLEDAHELVRNVMAATGWGGRDKLGKWRWAGLGRNGILEDACDWSGECSQNGQTFKGIFFHHFSVFCAPLRIDNSDEGRPWLRTGEVHTTHDELCEGYAEWVVTNAEAAIVTRDENGEYGQWWGREARTQSDDEGDAYSNDLFEEPKINGTDVMNRGFPDANVWLSQWDPDLLFSANAGKGGQDEMELKKKSKKPCSHRDLNDRGRGRTVETQSGGLGAVRAAWKLLASKKEKR